MTDQTEKKTNRKTIRFSDQQIDKINQVCKNNNCKQAKVVKSALDLVTIGTSDLEFDTVINNSEKPIKTLVIEHNNKGRILNSFEKELKPIVTVIEEN